MLIVLRRPQRASHLELVLEIAITIALEMVFANTFVNLFVTGLLLLLAGFALMILWLELPPLPVGLSSLRHPVQLQLQTISTISLISMIAYLISLIAFRTAFTLAGHPGPHPAARPAVCPPLQATPGCRSLPSP